MRVNCPDPLIQEPALSLVFLGVPAFGLQYKIATAYQANDEVWAILSHYPSVNVEDLETEVVVFHPTGYGGVVV
jgi:hypothetical protein